MNKLYGLLALVFLVGCGEEATTSTQAEEKLGTQISTEKLKTVSALPDIILGEKDAPVTILEYASPTCHHCANFHTGTLPKIKKDYIETGKVKLIYRNFIFDKMGLAAAKLTRCLPEERFYGMLEIVYGQQSDWVNSEGDLTKLKELFKLAGMNDSDMEVCLKEDDTTKAIMEQVQAANKDLGVNSTPTIIIGDRLFSGNSPYADLKAVIDAQLQ